MEEKIGVLRERMTKRMGEQAMAKLDSYGKDKKFECPHCYKIFTKSCALGGHISKMHPGKGKDKIKRGEEFMNYLMQ